jgi:hypothetical protein
VGTAPVETRHNLSVSLASFRANAVHIREAIRALAAGPSPTQVDTGYVRDPVVLARYQQLAIPVRRALNPGDRASASQALSDVERLAASGAADRETTAEPPPERGPRERATAVADARRQWEALEADLSGVVGLGGRRITRGELLTSWLEAAAFFSPLEGDRAFDRLLDEWGKAAKTIGCELADRAGRALVAVDRARPSSWASPKTCRPRPRRLPRRATRATPGGRASQGCGARSAYPARYRNMFLTTNHTLAGRSASRRMYQGNQYSP